MRSLTVFLLAAFAAVSTAAEKPNIVFILADDLGFGDVSCYNPESMVTTANLDRMAREGMRFTDAHSPSTVCTPTRYSILTGQMAFRLNYPGVFTGVGGPCLITEDRLTLPEMLRNEGYETAMFGKWHIGLSFLDEHGQVIDDKEPPKETDRAIKANLGVEAVRRVDFSRAIPDAPIHRGFDHFFGTACCPTSDWLYAFIDGDRIPVPPTEVIDKAKLPGHEWSFDCRPGLVAPDFDHEEVDMVFLEKSLDFLDQHAKEKPDKPFFLFHSLQAVHLPSFPGKDFQGKTEAGPHGDFIFQFDHIVGQLLAKLKAIGLDENTLVIVTSDNGPEVGTVLNMREKYGHDGARPWRGVKRDNWEGGHRVPMIVRWPGRIEAGSVAEQTVCLTDVMATCAELVGADLPNDAAEDSVSVLPVILGETNQEVRDFTLHQTISLALAIRKGKWKYLDHQGSGGNNYDRGKLAKLNLPNTAPDAPGQLYDLDVDPGETNNLYFENPEIVKQLKERLDRSVESGRSAPERVASRELILLEPGKVIVADDFAEKQMAKRVFLRGEWTVANGVASVVQDDEIYRKFNNHGPIIRYDFPFEDAIINFDYKGNGMRAFHCTVNGDDKWGLFRLGMNPTQSRLWTWVDGEGVNLFDGGPSLKDDEWVSVTIEFCGDTVAVYVGDEFQKTVTHSNFAKPKLFTGVRHAFGSFNMRNFSITEGTPKSRE